MVMTPTHCFDISIKLRHLGKLMLQLIPSASCMTTNLE